MSIDIFALVLIGGLLLGGIYALVAFGLSLIYGVARILNIAHGTLLAITGVVASHLYAATQWHPMLIMAVMVPPVFLFGYAFHVATAASAGTAQQARGDHRHGARSPPARSSS